MLKARIQNYQAIKDSEITVDGVAVMVGKNSVGKSSVFRALRNANLNSTSGDEFINFDADETRVNFRHNDLEFEWVKPRGEGAKYYIDGTEYDKIGRGSFDKLMECGLAPLVAGPDEFSLQFWGQMQPFLVCNRPDTRKFQLLSSIFDSDKFNDVLSEMKSDKKEYRDEIKDKKAVKDNNQDKIETKQQELECYEPLEAIDIEALETKVERYDTVKELKNDYTDVRWRYEELDEVISSVTYLDYKIDLDDRLDRLETIREYDKQYFLTKNKLDKYDDVLSTVSGIDYDIELDSKIDRLETITELLEDYESVNEYLSKIDIIDNMESGIDSALDSIEKVYNRYQDIVELNKGYESVKGKYDNHVSEVESLESERDEIQSKLDELEDELNECPVCGSEL